MHSAGWKLHWLISLHVHKFNAIPLYVCRVVASCHSACPPEVASALFPPAVLETVWQLLQELEVLINERGVQ